MADSLDRLTIKGFKSIRELKDFKLSNLNVMIGANGSGKSNFISFFKMMREMMDKNINSYIRDNGGIGAVLYNGRKTTEELEFEMRFGERGYRFKISPGTDIYGYITNEARYFENGKTGWWELGDAHGQEPRLVKEMKSDKKGESYFSKLVVEAVTSWKLYHFHDTGSKAKMRHYESTMDKKYLRFDGANIAPYLLNLKKNHEKNYKEIASAIRLVAPFFDEFILEPEETGEGKKVNLSWQQKGSDYPMQPCHLSDGTIRFICLATALLQPYPPSTIIIDEPELGLHPSAIGILAELVKSAAKRTQVLIATQSPAFIDHFTVEDIIIVKRKNGASTFERVDEKQLELWLEEYSVGELWTKNIILGGISYE